MAETRVKMIVTESPNFDLKVPIKTCKVTAGQDATYSIKIDPSEEFTSNINLSVSGLPENASANFDSSTITYNGNTKLFIDTSGVTSGNYSFNIIGNT